MMAFLKPFAGIVGTLLAALLILSGPYLYWYDRTPTAQPLLHWNFWFVHLNFPDNPSARYAALQAAEKAAAAHVQAVQVQQASVTAQASQREDAAQVQIRTITRTILKEVPFALTPAVDRAFPLSVGFVRLHDAAALGVDPAILPDPAGQPDGAASPVAESSAAQVVVSNYGVCRSTAEQLTALQDWITAQQAVTR